MGIREHPEEEDGMPVGVQFSLAYAGVLVGECLEEIDRVNKQVVHQDLLVRLMSFLGSTNANLPLSVGTTSWRG